VGAPGTVEGMIAAEAVEADPVPAAFVAVTVNVYEVPLVRPVTVQLVDAVVQVNEPGDDVTVYPVIAEPPDEAGALQDTTDWAFAFAVADTEVGAPGAVAGTTAPEAVDGDPGPAAFVAVTVNVYEVPFVRPVTVQLVDAVVQVNEPGEEVTV